MAVLVLCFVSLAVSAQGVYFDIGVGIGPGWTTLDGDDITDFLGGSTDVAVELGLKAGYGPVGNLPLYGVVEFCGMGHRIDASDFDYWFQINSYMIGPGIVVYPIPLLQLGLGLGLSFISSVDSENSSSDTSKGGFAWNISAAIDIGSGDHGLLLGVKFFNAINTLDNSYEPVLNSAILSFFARYAFRTKEQSY